MRIFFLVCLFGGIHSALSLSSYVRTSHGPIEGFEYDSAAVFLGIRYGKPPVGERRFEKPEAIGNWTEPLQAKSFGPSCHPTTPQNYTTFSEDCLFLNIMAPKRDPVTAYPVIIYIHGGGLESGGAVKRGYEHIVKNFVNEGIVFVTINYRLGPFGFLTTADDVLPGNLGLWDQLLALKLVSEMISSFNGDPNRITLMGDSSGAMSVSAFTLSPLANNLFHQAVQMSGTFYSLPLKGNRKHGLNFLDTVGCTEKNLYQAKECLKKSSLEEILKVTYKRPHLYPLLERFYINEADSDYKSCLTQLVNLVSDINFNVPVFQEAIEKLHNNWPVYLYIEKFYSMSPRRALFPVDGSFHSNEIPYLFGKGSMLPVIVTKESNEFKRNLLHSLTSFVKYGEPRSVSVPWDRMSVSSPFTYMELNATCEAKSDFFEKRIQFWTTDVANHVDLEELKSILPQAKRNIYSKKRTP
ncbi:hypothetical protein QR680_009730 [Steinernema hermaphroditum]|uniref:Carboxylesterase type B domain-containing protein n=1 Tax=Steinernema hermaphroditum TaxID=289476 RepID=A0AA39ILG4_9BILA|nr:hypothetical protein QR680_009730 [Steinernema hermaphroditum]